MKFETPFSELEALGIRIKEYEDIYILNYSQSDSPKKHPISDKCRALIIDKNTKEILCRSFDRFYNYGEMGVPEHFPYEKANWYEKVDGSLINIWHHPKTGWQISTRKMAYAEGVVGDYDYTFRDLVKSVIDMNVFKNENPNHTFIFELVSPFSQVVKYYEEAKIYLLAIRDRATGEYISTDPYSKIFDRPEVFDIKSIQESEQYIKQNLEDTDEGFVAEYNGMRVKVKNPDYVKKHRMANNGVLGFNAAVQLILDGEVSEYLSYFPEKKSLLDKIENGIEQLKTRCEDDLKLHYTDDAKEFASRVKKLKHSTILFKMYRGKTFNEIFESLFPKIRKRLINYTED